jgi:hypothetical protein
MLILVQLTIPLLPAGPCTCPRAASVKKSGCSCCHDEGGCANCSTSANQSRRQPCQDPTCPANRSIVRLETGLLGGPTISASAMFDSHVELTEVSSSRSQRRTFDSEIVVSPQLFLVYGAMLI